jgi:hypothetical protein
MTTVTSGLRSIKGRIRRLIDGPREPRPQLLTIPVDRCRHYNGYKYGSSAFNPYENYIVGMHQGIDRAVLRDRFEDFLVHFRPRDLGELLQVPLSRKVPMWVFPWDAGAPICPNGGWLETAVSVEDIITHFSEQGIQRSKIAGEYFWLERALDTIATMGYQPEEFSYIDILELRDGNESVYIVKDGNHRLSSLVAFGHTHVVVSRDANETVDLTRCARWPHVVSGLYTVADARALFRAYFTGVAGFPRAVVPAAILNQ